MLLIDGAKYELWTPPSEDEFERVVKEHTQEIFGEQSIYFDRKQKLKSLSGIGSIPDGYVIIFGDSPRWHIVEVELSSHPLHEHIVSQVSKFITGIINPNLQRGIVNAIFDETTRDEFLKLKIKRATEPSEIYKFLLDLISKPPILTIIIEKDTEGLREAVSTLAHPQIKVVEFQTFAREMVGLAVHAHIFESLFEPQREEKKLIRETKKESKELPEGIKRVTASQFIHKGNGIFIWKSDSSVTIDVKKKIRLVREQLARQGLWNKEPGSFYWFLRKKAGLLNTPTQD